MAHDVFISYSSKDKPTADATCAVLEQSSIRCWMAPRDITPGADWSESIVDAINGSRAMVLVFSTNANLSPQIKREVERAVNKGIPIIPLRIENVMPEKSLEYFLSTPHWLDAFNPPLEQHLNYLAEVIHHILDGKAVPPPKPTPAPAAKLDRRTLMTGGAAVVVALVGWMMFGPSKPPSWVGHWKMVGSTADADTPSPFGAFSISTFAKAALASGKLTGTMDVNDLGNYKYVWGGEDHGTVTAKGRDKLIFTSDITHQSQEFNYIVTNAEIFGASAPQLGGKSTDGSIALQFPGGSQSILVGNPSGAGGPLSRVAGHWYTDTPTTPIGGVKTSLDITQDGHYNYKFSLAETGMFEAKDGQWTRMPQSGIVAKGTYKFQGRNKVTAASAQGSSDWKRAN